MEERWRGGGGTQFRYDDNKDKLSVVDMKRNFCRRDLCCQGKNENEKAGSESEQRTFV